MEKTEGVKRTQGIVAGDIHISSQKPVIDTHAHWYPKAWVEMLFKDGPKYGAKVGRNDKGYVTYTGSKTVAVFTPPFVDLDERIQAMDRQGVDVHALSLTTPMVYWAPPEIGLAFSEMFNDCCVEAYAKYPKRLVGMAMLPMQDPKLALKELERIGKKPGLRGVYMSTFPAAREVDYKEYFPVYAKCEELDWPIFVHPVEAVGSERTARFYLGNLLGNTFESGIAGAYFVFGGVMDAFPKLQVMLPHGGGTFPWLSGRLDRGVAVRPELKHMRRPASAYLRRFHYDTITHSTQILSFLIQLVGADRVVLGSDYCFDLGYDAPVQVIEKFPAEERSLILGGNAAKLLKI